MYLGVLLHIELVIGYSKEVVAIGMYWASFAPHHPGLFKAAIP